MSLVFVSSSVAFSTLAEGYITNDGVDIEFTTCIKKRVINLPIVTLICRRCEAPREVGAQGKMGKEKSSLRPSHHPLHPNLPLCKGWGRVRFCQ